MIELKMNPGENMTDDAKKFLCAIASNIGPGVRALSFAVRLKSGETLTDEDFQLGLSSSDGDSAVFIGKRGGCGARWEFTRLGLGYAARLTVEENSGAGILSIDNLIAEYRPEGADLARWRAVFQPCDGIAHRMGFPLIAELGGEPVPCSVMTGAFPGSRGEGFFMGTVMPIDSSHTFTLAQIGDGGLRFASTTSFLDSVGSLPPVRSEACWMAADKSAGDSIEAFASLIPPDRNAKGPAIGWNSWDYYFFSVSLDDLIENMEEIRMDPVLSRRIKYIVIDEGWEHRQGEWEPNHRFPGGLERAAKEITDRGFIPGIWTSCTLIDMWSHAGLRRPELFVKNENGDPQAYGGSYLLDPTAPAGERFLRELFTKLRKAGFLFYKCDFISTLLGAGAFYDRTKGPYRVIRDMFGLIRECVGPESHIMGCGMPPECGPGVVDSQRTGIDIHNQWEHVKWAMEGYTCNYWMNGRMFATDVDFLLVRGKDTSLEEATNVVNPHANDPDTSNPFIRRWRRGPVFSADEAQTWANLVMMSGGNVFISDRISMVNDLGRSIYRGVLKAERATAVPLDLCEGFYVQFWLQRLPGSCRLAVVNWDDEPREIAFRFADYGMRAPEHVTDFITGRQAAPRGGAVAVFLRPHQSAVFRWPADKTQTAVEQQK